MTADGKRVVSLGESGDGHIWDARTGEHFRRVEMSWQQGFALSPDGRFLVWPMADESIHFQKPGEPNSSYTGSRLQVLDLETGAMVERFAGFEGNPHDLYFTPDGKLLVTVDRWRSDANVRVWNVATGKVERSIPAEWKPKSRVLLSRLSPNGKLLAVMYQGEMRGSSVESAVKLWDIATGKEVHRPTPAWFQPGVITFTQDRKMMAVAAPPFGMPIYFHDSATQQPLGKFTWPREQVTALAFGPDGQLFTGTREGTVLKWDPRAAELPK